MSKDSFVGRQDDIVKIQKVLMGENRAHGSLSVCSIEGPGGIGKTALYDRAVQTAHLGPRRYLTLRAASRENLHGASPFAVIENLATSAHAAGLEKKPTGHYFPKTRQVLDAVAEVRSAVAFEADRRFPGDVMLRGVVLKAADAALAEGRPLPDFAQSLKKVEEFRDVSQRIEPAFLERSLRAFRSVRPQRRVLFGLGPDVRRVGLKNAVRQNALKVCADALVADLKALLGKRRPLGEIERLLIVVDDYEFLMSHFGELFVRSLLPTLRMADFPTAVFVIGRDRLSATDPYWNKELAATIVERVVVGPLGLGDFVELCRMYAVTDAAARDAIWKETSGYPFLIKLLLDEIAEQKSEGLDGPSALMLRAFYERTTRFMSDVQRRWLESVLFLDDVNKRSLRAFFSDPDEIDRIQEWLEREPSIRDPNAATFRVRPQLAKRLLEYLNRRDPDRYDALSAKVAKANPTPPSA